MSLILRNQELAGSGRRAPILLKRLADILPTSSLVCYLTGIIKLDIRLLIAKGDGAQRIPVTLIFGAMLVAPIFIPQNNSVADLTGVVHLPHDNGGAGFWPAPPLESISALSGGDPSQTLLHAAHLVPLLTSFPFLFFSLAVDNLQAWV
jgi:hypothetical protein